MARKKKTQPRDDGPVKFGRGQPIPRKKLRALADLELKRKRATERQLQELAKMTEEEAAKYLRRQRRAQP